MAEVRYNLGNVCALIRSEFPPMEEDGVTEKRYILWAQPVAAPNESYSIKYYDGYLDAWIPLMGVTQGQWDALIAVLFGNLGIPDSGQVQNDLGAANIYALLKLANLPQKIAPYPIAAFETVSSFNNVTVAAEPFEIVWDAAQKRFFVKKGGNYFAKFSNQEYYSNDLFETKQGILFTMDKGNGNGRWLYVFNGEELRGVKIGLEEAPKEDGKRYVRDGFNERWEEITLNPPYLRFASGTFNFEAAGGTSPLGVESNVNEWFIDGGYVPPAAPALNFEAAALAMAQAGETKNLGITGNVNWSVETV